MRKKKISWKNILKFPVLFNESFFLYENGNPNLAIKEVSLLADENGNIVTDENGWQAEVPSWSRSPSVEVCNPFLYENSDIWRDVALRFTCREIREIGSIGDEMFFFEDPDEDFFEFCKELKIRKNSFSSWECYRNKSHSWGGEDTWSTVGTAGPENFSKWYSRWAGYR